MKKISRMCAAALTIALVAGSLCGCAKSKLKIRSTEDLAGKKIGVQAGTTGENWVLKNVQNPTVASFKSGMDAALDLKNRAIDAVVLDALPAQEMAVRNPELKIIHCKAFAENKENYAIAVKKGNTQLLSVINQTIEQIKTDGTYDRLVKAFMSADGKITVPEAEALSGSKTLKLGTNASFPPFEYVDSKTIVGFDISIGQKIAKNAGMKLEIVDMAFEGLIPALQSGKIDFIAAAMSVDEERQSEVDFSEPYFESEQVIIVRK